jgi:hypothetical protein
MYFVELSWVGFVVIVILKYDHQPAYQTEGIMPEGRINKIADSQEPKFLRRFGLTNVHCVHTPKYNSV